MKSSNPILLTILALLFTFQNLQADPQIKGAFRGGIQFDDNMGEGGKLDSIYWLPITRLQKDSNTYTSLSFLFTHESQSQLHFSIDKGDTKGYSHYSAWEKEDPFRIRDMWMEFPLFNYSNTSIWIGNRTKGLGDIAVFDDSPFSNNILGWGIKIDGLEVSHGIHKDYPHGFSLNKGTSNLEDPSKVLRHYHSFTYQLGLSSNSSLDTLFEFQKVNELSAFDGKLKVESSSGYKVGLVHHYWNQNLWNNTFLLFVKGDAAQGMSGDIVSWKEGSVAVTKSEDHKAVKKLSSPLSFNLFKDVEAHQMILFGLSGNYEKLIPQAGLLYGLVYKHKKVGDKVFGKQGEQKNSINGLSTILRPVYYVHKQLHLGMDLNYVLEFSPRGEKALSQWLISPLLKYAFNEGTLSQPSLSLYITQAIFSEKVTISGKNSKNHTNINAVFEWYL